MNSPKVGAHVKSKSDQQIRVKAKHCFLRAPRGGG
jgi:hypothetical protein